MRILECPPSDKQGYIDEADQFYMNPLSWLNEQFENSSDHREVNLPTHIVMYNVLLTVSKSFLLFANKAISCSHLFCVQLTHPIDFTRNKKTLFHVLDSGIRRNIFCLLESFYLTCKTKLHSQPN